MKNFFIENAMRFLRKSPKFFFIWQIISGSMFVVGLLPEFLCRYFDMTAPPGFVNFAEDVSKVAAGMFITSKMTVDKQSDKHTPYSMKNIPNECEDKKV